RALRGRDRGHRRRGADATDPVARIRVQGEADRPQTPPAAGRPVPPPARLAHVVRGPVLADVSGMVRAVSLEASRGGSADAAPPRAGSVPGKATAVRPGPVLPLSLHDARRAPRDRRVVAPRALGDLRARGEAARLTSGRCGARASTL